MRSAHFLALTTACVLASLSTDSRAADPPAQLPTAADHAQWGSAPVVVVGRITSAVAGPVGLSEPPLRTYRLEIAIERTLRGPFAMGEKLTAGYSIRQSAEPVFPPAAILALKQVQGRWQVTKYEAAGDDLARRVEAAARIPLGWRVTDEGLVSPWVSLPQPTWPPAARAEGPWVCVKTGRPALGAGEAVQMTVEPVPPAKEVRFANPDGDGEFRVTLTNSSKEAITVPALLVAGEEILWRESLVIVCQGTGYAVPGAKGVEGEVEAARLAPGESVSTTVNVLGLDGPEWPRGGYRIEFQFCLGELGETYSLYYLSRHHDPLRAKARQD